MTEIIKQLDLERDYKTYLYFIDGQGNVVRKRKTKEGEVEILHAAAVERDSKYLYFINKDGNIARTERGKKAGNV